MTKWGTVESFNPSLEIQLIELLRNQGVTRVGFNPSLEIPLRRTAPASRPIRSTCFNPSLEILVHVLHTDAVRLAEVSILLLRFSRPGGVYSTHGPMLFQSFS